MVTSNIIRVLIRSKIVKKIKCHEAVLFAVLHSLLASFFKFGI